MGRRKPVQREGAPFSSPGVHGLLGPSSLCRRQASPAGVQSGPVRQKELHAQRRPVYSHLRLQACDSHRRVDCRDHWPQRPGRCGRDPGPQLLSMAWGARLDGQVVLPRAALHIEHGRRVGPPLSSCVPPPPPPSSRWSSCRTCRQASGRPPARESPACSST